MKIIKTKFKGLFLCNKETYTDSRGYFRELFIESIIKKKFLFDVMSCSKKRVLRGLHFQTVNPQGKYISVLRGKVFDVVVDLRKKSKTFGKYYSTILSEKSNISLFIPEGFAHGFCTLENNTIMLYKCTNYRNEKTENGLIWDDKDLNIKWPIKNPIISKKDKNAQSFKYIVSNNKTY
jgi:dTDP-4-dehydrorhamnose 3,5-epimerase